MAETVPTPVAQCEEIRESCIPFCRIMGFSAFAKIAAAMFIAAALLP
jgi:hypothetical protein